MRQHLEFAGRLAEILRGPATGEQEYTKTLEELEALEEDNNERLGINKTMWSDWCWSKDEKIPEEMDL